MSIVEWQGGRESIEARLRQGLAIGVAAAAQLVAQRATKRAPVRTGRLARSITTSDVFQEAPLIFACYVGTNVEYAAAQEMGSGLHAPDPADRDFIIIEPRYARALAFRWPDGPKDHPAYDPESGLFFFRRVHHPGVPPQPYLRPALAEAEAEIAKVVLSAVHAALTGEGQA